MYRGNDLEDEEMNDDEISEEEDTEIDEEFYEAIKILVIAVQTATGPAGLVDNGGRREVEDKFEEGWVRLAAGWGARRLHLSQDGPTFGLVFGLVTFSRRSSCITVDPQNKKPRHHWEQK
ncbi:hypothetical protein LWI28_004245 [Acer negundo]|uniref:Uncharacterized protein n=1 Tax=Acer negundo TaxID=4023 RepID=A0AAD5ID77_ACENE|nr:hypothetical protein LWI28_004245 [Acer negundo]